MTTKMCHLHLHTYMSVLDAISKPSDVVKKIKEYGHTAVSITDHGTISGTVEFYDACNSNNIKPILGSEFYMYDENDSENKRATYHIVLLAMNQTGWTNIKLLTTRASDKFYFKPRISMSDIAEFNEGIICTSACLKGIIQDSIVNEDFIRAAEFAKKFKDIFGDRFYLETQDGGISVQPKINEYVRKLSEHLNIGVIATQDSHYINIEDVEAHEALWAIRTKDTFDKPVGYNKGKAFRTYYSTREYWLKDYRDMLGDVVDENGKTRKSSIFPSELDKTMEIEARIGSVIIDKKMRLPKYQFIQDGGSNAVDHLTNLILLGFHNKYKIRLEDATLEYRERITKELKDIKDAELADYFLIIYDIVSYAKYKNIPMGPGRGSAAGSLVSYVLGITGVDPIRYGLIWERFYNTGRKGAMPDIDLDFSRARRGEVIKYIEKRFGVDKVAQMVTFNTLATKAALKDVTKVLGSSGMSFDEANVMTRYVASKVKDLDDAISKNDKLKEYEQKNQRLFNIARKIEGCPKSSGQHPAGVIISDESFSAGSIPLRWNVKEKKKITEWDGVTLDALGYMKVDILGLNTLDIQYNVQEDVNRRNKNDRKSSSKNSTS